MERLIEAIQEIPEVAELLRSAESGGCPAAMTGLGPVHRAHMGAALLRGGASALLALCADEGEARRMAADLQAFTGEEAVVLPGREFRFHPAAVTSRGWEEQRLAALYRIAAGEARIIAATPDALAQRTMPKEQLLSAVRTLRPGDTAEPAELAEHLLRCGYSRCEQVEGPGQFALRGGILDVFGPGMASPVRVEFFGDEVDAMGAFDTASQRRTENVKSVLLLPADEVLPEMAEGGAAGLAGQLDTLRAKLEKKKSTRQELLQALERDAELLREHALHSGLDRYAAAVWRETVTPAAYLPADCAVCVCDSARVTERLKNDLWRAREDVKSALETGTLAGEWAQLTVGAEELWKDLGERPLYFLNSLPTSRYPLPPKSLLQLNAKQLSSYGGSLETAAADMEQYLKEGFRVLVLCSSQRRAQNLQSILQVRGIPASLDFDMEALPAPGAAQISLGALSAGIEYAQISLAVLTEGQLLAPKQKKSRTRSAKTNRQKLQSYTDLTPGDLVVHVHHGVGRFVGIFKMTVDGADRDYIKIAYAGSDCLYVPATQLDLVSKYIGGGEHQETMRLNKLGGTDWARSTRRAKAAAKDLAKGLIQLYAERQKKRGFAFSPDSPWQLEFEEAFPYEETEDQLRCIREVKSDMERPVPMDRLLCGDVGYGKTEVALRAVMKCILDGKQAAILVPTTVLAQQHYATAVSRFRSFPVNIAVLSRFQTPKASRKILQDLKTGAVDLLIGTHRLLQKGVEFKDLGLLVIDEEQHFGVTHKEKLKEMARQVDVLTLSATPIPRTLNMALSGVRDMSTLEAPPQDRQPVQTYVIEHDWGMLADAMRREIQRHGQVYYLHNRVENIDRTAAHIQQLLGEEVRVVTAHGKLSEQQLSAVMQEVIDGQAQVLVCTTIIETGIDIPNVNTLIVEDADHLGLAQLHQIRGRIGRSARRAYAYMTYRRGKVLSETADKRLTAIREYVEFGSGFKIAMRDLEIRGAGNLLGPEQSGFMMSVGYDLYLKLLEEAVLEERGEERKKEPECTADLNISANIPERYVAAPEQRMDLYRRIAAIRTREDADDLTDELLDRYGDLPRSVRALLDVALLRAAAAKLGVSEIAQKDQSVRFSLTDVDLQRIAAVCGMKKYRARLRLEAGGAPAVVLRLQPKEDILEQCMELVDALHGAAPAEKS